MAQRPGTLEAVAKELGRALHPLSETLGSDYFSRLGVDLPRAISGDAALNAKLDAAKTAASDLDVKIEALAAAITAENTVAIVDSGAQLVGLIGQLSVALGQAGAALDAAILTLPAPERAPLQDIAAQLAARSIEAMGVRYLSERLPDLATTLSMIGLIDAPFKPLAPIDVRYTPRDLVAPRLYLNRLPLLISDPAQYLQQTFKWGAADFDGAVLLRKVQALIETFGASAAYYENPGRPPSLEAYLLSLQADDGVSPPGLKLELSLPGNTAFTNAINFGPLWKGTVEVKANYGAGATIALRPPFALSATPPSGAAHLDLKLGLKAEKTAADPITILAVTGGSKLQARSIAASIGLVADLGPGGGALEPSLQVRLDDGKLIIDFSEGDGFIQSILSGVHLEGTFGLAADWNPTTGLRMQGQGGLEVFLPTHIDLVAVEVNGLYLAMGIGAPAALEIGLGSQLTAKLGPLVAVVDNIGVNASIDFPEGGGNLGLADIRFRFRPPKGVGLSIDTGVVKGGGFLYLDPDKGEYFGALELSFQGVIALKAVGIINTKMPDGSSGFALLILITAEFIPIQLGFGFTLLGVGGLLGANRTTNLDALRTGVRTGAVSSILFPQDIVANINRIVSDLKAIFPVAKDHFLIGPMGKLGWGTPTLISLELGLIIEIPSPRIVILGVLRCILPDEDAAILKLQVNFAGGVDFDEGLIWFDASLFDSSLLLYTLTGDMALRIGWNDPMFVLSVGGFHPAFKEIPSDLTGMRRIMLSLLSGDNPRLSAQTYFAVTSNTVQNGARVELYAEACGFNIYGYIGYDLLVQFNPFHILAEIGAGVALREGSHAIAGIHVHCILSGPTPWHADGEASLSFLFFDISVGFSVSWGDEGPAQPVETENVLALVKTALEDKRNWKADLPPNANQGATLRKIEQTGDDVLIHPFGVLSVSQKVAPLGLPISKFGNKKPAGATVFELTCSEPGVEEVKEEFALASFVEMTDAEKIAHKSFEKIRSGLRLTPLNATQTGFSILKEVDYELSYISKKKNPLPFGHLVKMFALAFETLVKGGSAANSVYAVARKKAVIGPAKVDVAGPRYMVVNVDDLALHAPNMTAASEAQAYAMQADAVARNPALRGALQVVSAFEMS